MVVSPLVRNHSLPTRAQQQQQLSSSPEENERRAQHGEGVNNSQTSPSKKTSLGRARSVDASKGLDVALEGLALSPSSVSTPTSPRASIKPLAPPPRSKARPAPTPTPTTSIPTTPSTEESAPFNLSSETGSSSSLASSSLPSLASPSSQKTKSSKGPPSPILVFSASSSDESMSNDSGVFLVKAAEEGSSIRRTELELEVDPLTLHQTPTWTVPSLPSPSNTVYSTPTTPSGNGVSSPSTWRFPTAPAAATPPSPAVSHFTPLSPDLNPVGPLPKRRASSGIYTPASFPGPAGRNSSAPSARDQELAAQAKRSSLAYGARRKSSGLGLGLGIGTHGGGGGSTSAGASPVEENAGGGGGSSNASSPVLAGGFLARGRSYFGLPSASLLGGFGLASPSTPTSSTTSPPPPGSISPTGVYTPRTFSQAPSGTKRYTPLSPTSLDGSLPHPSTSTAESAYAASHNHHNLHLHLPLSSRTPQPPLNLNTSSGAPLTSPPLPVTARKASSGSSSTPVKRKPVPSAESVGMSYRSHSNESNGSSVDDVEHDKSVKTPSPERLGFSQGGGKAMMRMLEVEHVGLGAEKEGRVW